MRLFTYGNGHSVLEVAGSRLGRGNIVRGIFHPTRQPTRFSPPSTPYILNLFIISLRRETINYSPLASPILGCQEFRFFLSGWAGFEHFGELANFSFTLLGLGWKERMWRPKGPGVDGGIAKVAASQRSDDKQCRIWSTEKVGSESVDERSCFSAKIFQLALFVFHLGSLWVSY